MWELYSRNYLKGNRTVGRSIRAIILISSFLLSFITILFYNLWLDEKARSAWEGRAWRPSVLTWIYGTVLSLVCLTLLVMIYHAFEMTKDGRLHQLGILQSVGATPRQIYMVLAEEAFVLGIPAMIPGILAGAAGVYLLASAVRRVNRMTGKPEMVFDCPLGLLLLVTGICVLVLLLAANCAATGLSRITALEALRGGAAVKNETRRFRAVPWPAGIEWELARRSLHARRRSFRTASLSLALACMAFSLYLNFWAMSSASRQHTYFERYESTWDEERYAAEMENEKLLETGYTLFVGGMSGLLACIGVANVFANTLGSVQMRKREFARYRSLGFTDRGMWKIVMTEGCLTALRPILFCLPVNLCFVVWGVSYAPITWKDYLAAAPILPFGLFAGAVMTAVGSASFLAGRKILRADLLEGLKDDTQY